MVLSSRSSSHLCPDSKLPDVSHTTRRRCNFDHSPSAASDGDRVPLQLCYACFRDARLTVQVRSLPSPGSGRFDSFWDKSPIGDCKLENVHVVSPLVMA